MSADFEWFKKQVYNHATAMPEQWKQLDGEGAPTTRGRVRMGNFSPKRLPESQLQEIWTWMNDLGMVVPLVARLTSGATSATGTTYTLNVENKGLKDKGVAAEDVTISLILPPGTKAASATGTGYEVRSGTRRRMQTWPSGACRNWLRTNIRTSRLPSRELLRAMRCQEERWHTPNPRPRLTRS